VRLVLRQGRWFLEISRLVSTGEGVFQPRSTRIEGTQAIVEALRRSKHGKGLVDGAAKLVANGIGSDDVSFDAVDGVWVPSRRSPSHAKQVAPGDARTPMEAALLAELTMLRASHEGLIARVARLERIIARQLDGEPIRPKRASRKSPVPAAAPDEASVSAAPGEDGSAADRLEAAEPPPDPARPPGAIEFPALGLVTDALKQLCGHDIPLKEMRHAPSRWLEKPARFYASWLADEAGEIQGGIVCDTEAAARLGGAYLAMPQADIEGHAAAEEPGEDVLSATSDICNTLSGLVNDLRENPRVSAAPLRPLAEQPPPWIDSPSVRIVCVHPGGGTVAFLSR